MDVEGGESNSSSSAGFDRQMPENCVEYLIFVIDSEADRRKHLSLLDGVRKAAVQLAADLTKDYIWQRDGFNVQVTHKNGLVYLHGVTDYGDSVEDEWLIVYMLRELTKSNPSLWVRVSDTDGEFLLIEAARVIPKWLSPEVDLNRVWIHDGRLRIIPIEDAISSKPEPLTLTEAVQRLKSAPDSLVHSEFVEAEAFYKLEKYPEQITWSLHRSLVTIPRKLAFILHSCPKSIAPAVEAFYLRDAISLKRLYSASSGLIFPPQDLVTVSVCFTKVLFGQVRSQRFNVPPAWVDLLQTTRKDKIDSPTGNTLKEQSRLEMGMKLTCGFEMMAVAANNSNNRFVREVGILLDDLNEDGEGSLPTDEDIKTWKDSSRDDDERWMDVNYEDFEKELQGRHSINKDGFGDPKAQADLRKLVSRFESFLNDEDAGPEGAVVEDGDLDEDSSSTEGESDEDKEVSFDEEQFAEMMREMMGLPPTEGENTNQAAEAGGAASQKGKQPVIAGHDEEDKEIRALMTKMQAELDEHGVLKLDPTPKKLAALREKSQDRVFGERLSSKDDTDDSEESSDAEVDLDYNLAKNILESFKSQAGMAGPAGNILGLMGLQLPRDDDDEDEGGNGNARD